ncbi:MAG TPA: XdhC family protein [Streptosporangiaceae bacterium]|jgi:xanthine dehydrogenase accessory factor|nr:XdhC family protein [Streptosporangiaceae bacterium]
MDGWGVLERASELARQGRAFAMATVVWRQGPSSGQLGSRAIITADGEVQGWIGGACAEPVVIREARQVISDGESRLLLLGTPDQFGETVPEGMTVVPIACQSEGALEVFIEPVQPAPRLVIVGRSPMAQTLADLAGALGWRTALMGSREFSAADADGHSMVVVATQGHGDEEVMEQAVAARPAYLGLVASQRRGAAVLGYLKDRGVPQDRLDRIKVPAGLNLGRTSHREIAVAILAELVQLRAAGEIGGGMGGPSVTSTGATGTTGAHAGHAERAAPAAGQRAASAPAVAAPAEAVDPVCGMTVVADDSSYPLVHDGVTYYFCRVGCRRAFEADPAAYVKKGTRC